MLAKHLSHDPAALVQAALGSLPVTNPAVGFDATNKTVYLHDACEASNVAIVSGGGSGHEPAFAGFVGKGMLAGAVAGSIFASPTSDQIFRCLRRLGAKDPQRGILVIIMNYTGDKLHFGMAVEKARAHGLKVTMLVVGDDVGVGRRRAGRIGRRGLAGTALVQKIAGALAAKGSDLEEVTNAASTAAANVVTVGASLAHVHVPGRDAVQDELHDNDEIEIGMGIHNEEGFSRVREDLPGLVQIMLKQLLDTTDKDRAFIDIRPGDGVALMVNNLGGLSQLELGAVTMEISQQLRESYQILPRRILSGAYMSSLNGLGFSITLLKLVDDGFCGLLDAPVNATGWSPSVPAVNWSRESREGGDSVITEDSLEEGRSSNLQLNPALTQALLTKALNNLIAAEPEVTKYDTLVGDGDCGLCLKRGAEAVLEHISSKDAVLGDATQLVGSIAHVVETCMDGTSGALYAIFFNALANSLRRHSGPEPGPTSAAVWAAALGNAVGTLSQYTPARPGDRTVVDALAPFVEVFAATSCLRRAVEAAEKGCESTKGMQASLGRSVYVGGDKWMNCPDPGAYGLLQLLKGFVGSS